MKYPLLALALLLLTPPLSAQSRTDPATQPAELGQVSWYRDYDQATLLAEQTGKPVLILFQEVPGCATCQRYGASTLSHPLMVEAIEHEFVPLAIYNNQTGADARILEQYGEPSWNNPVVRIVGADGRDLTDRVAGNYSPLGLYTAMTDVLTSHNNPIPGYLDVLGLELTGQDTPTREAYYQMYCFWSGEHHLGNQPGVVTTEPGFLNGHEVVKVAYDPTAVSQAELARYAAEKDIKPVPAGRGYRTATKDHYYQLQQTDFVYLPLTDVQKTKINAAVGRGTDLTEFLSPKQLAYYRAIRAGTTKKEKLYDQAFSAAWAKMQ